MNAHNSLRFLSISTQAKTRTAQTDTCILSCHRQRFNFSAIVLICCRSHTYDRGAERKKTHRINRKPRMQTITSYTFESLKIGHFLCMSIQHLYQKRITKKKIKRSDEIQLIRSFCHAPNADSISVNHHRSQSHDDFQSVSDRPAR